ncbi:MAG: pyruvate ferredoxin oxidoreductase [Candidatus Buchananbacteria bacterium RIFCSPHIGHO2_02_FULL_40_13]|uniref:Pyruvate ferredoxin oxidoreductase n=1 Tax=Candidatus Buchananbacteria bacterium RIFCSPLOWO2_01_FULL_39_33 TaxID=1797543 RepID=A0A1G1YIG9_9BACT|nr:MAG: pyruvate ferredoxin oxidoreductase [Candidatus Buchananbacteria bacterium RIFCSPHIGHO2_01_FULL_40_35]OGY49685.1 MAG: pyruvate ferredoxin oxidoreductase [Candidatus Buchananbacteria bacterium RIFCSPHIGHO2_02_FULL_40_13]OGY52135.1 MAG: pyruvate ferredoxin oxidoreductase [Candidatus Buchananbacteria bacterium RIFCSPLOWO2_01_FULL_39_33]
MPQDIKTKYKSPLSHLLNPGHTACAGCGMIVAARLVLDAAGPNTIVTNATGCSEVTTTQYPMTSYKQPWIHSLFENPAAVASGILAALKVKGLADKINVIAIGGDGATFDIGLVHISGMWERGENILYVCYDNEAYQNTGYQSSGATPLAAATSTTPAGNKSWGSDLPKKDMIRIALAHNLPYVATATTGYPLDIIAKTKKALSIKGPKYLQIYTPCVPGWGIEPKDTLSTSQLAVQSGFYPIVEYVNGELIKAQKITKKVPVENFLKLQKRFKHLFKSPEGQKEIAKIQALAEKNIRDFNLL